MARARRRDAGGDGDRVSWSELEAAASPVMNATSYQAMRDAHRDFRSKLDGKFGAGAGDALASKVVNVAQTYARMFGLPADEVARKTASTWTLGVGWHECPPENRLESD